MEIKYIVLITFGHLFTDINQGALPALLPFLISQHGLSYTAAAGLIFAANFLSSIVQPVFGIISDRHPKAWMMVFGVFLAGIGTGLSGYISNYPVLFALLSLGGLGVAMFHPEGALLTNVLSGTKKATGLSVFSLGGNGGYAIGPIIATIAVLYLGFRGTFILFVLSLLMALAMIPSIPKFNLALINQNAIKNKTRHTSQNSTRAFLLLTCLISCRSSVFSGLNTFIPLLWVHYYHTTSVQGAIALATFFIMGIFGTIIGGNLADKLGYTSMVKAGFFILLPSLVAFSLFNNVILASALIVPIGFATYMVFSPMIALGQRYLPNNMGLASGVTTGLSVSVGGILVPFLGVLADQCGLIPVFYILAAISAIAVPLSLALPKN